MVILRNPYSKVDLKIGKWKLLSQNIDVIKITVENLFDNFSDGTVDHVEMKFN